MLAFIIRRILASIPVVILSTFATFLLAASTADPLSRFKGRNPPIPHNVIVNETKRLGLDHALIPRYFVWLKNVFVDGSFGQSVNVTYDIGRHLSHAITVTLRLVTASIFVALFLALITGILSAVKQYSRLDYTTTFTGFLFLSLPTFWFAILIKNWAIQVNDTIGSRIFFTQGDSSAIPPDGFWPQIMDKVGHLILPTVILSLITYATWSRFLRSSMLDVLNSDYMRLAKAKGLSPSRVLVRHGLRTALIPMTTQVAIDIAGLLSGTIITEFIFNWDGMGSMFLTALNNQDVNVLLAWLLVIAGLVIVFNLIADLLYAVLDPRIRLA